MRRGVFKAVGHLWGDYQGGHSREGTWGHLAQPAYAALLPGACPKGLRTTIIVHFWVI